MLIEHIWKTDESFEGITISHKNNFSGQGGKISLNMVAAVAKNRNYVCSK